MSSHRRKGSLFLSIIVFQENTKHNRVGLPKTGEVKLSRKKNQQEIRAQKDPIMILVLVVDGLLLVLNLWHAFNLVAIMTPVEAVYKKCLVDIQYKWGRYLQSSHLYTIGISLTLLVAAIYFGVYHRGDHDEHDDHRIPHILRLSILGCTVCCSILQKKALSTVIALGPEQIMEQGHELERLEILNFSLPSKRLLNMLLAPMNFIHPADFQGLEHMDHKTPSLFVANHTLYGIDMAPLVDGLYQEKGVFLRGLADHIHFGLPYAPLIRWMGGVDGTRTNAELLMKAKQNVLVYPGGQREVLKHSGVPKYSLMWGERMGFARLAIQHGYPVVPVASVGVEHMIDILFDLPFLGIKLPFPKPFSPLRLQKIYYWIGEPIPTSQYDGDWQNQEFVRELRDNTRSAIESGVEMLLQKQISDPERFLTQQIRARIRRWASAMTGLTSTDTEKKKM
jgi:1-acyl-sn-glycerol-3-phosphate acyltransferase